MDSDVSVEGDGDSEQSPNRSWASNQSVGSRSTSASPDRNTDERSSSSNGDDDDDEQSAVSSKSAPLAAASPPQQPPKKRAVTAADSSSERESSPETKRRSEETSDGGGAAALSSPEARRRPRNGAVERRETSSEVESRKQSSAVDSDGETTPEMANDGADDDDDDVSDSSPDAAQRAPTAPAKSPLDEVDDDDDTKRTKSPDSSPDAQPAADDSEAEERSPPRNAAAARSPAQPVSPENGAWSSSESDAEKTAPNSPEAPASPEAGSVVAGDEPAADLEESTPPRRFAEYDTNDESSRHRYDEPEDRRPDDHRFKKRVTSRRPVDSDEGELFGSVNGDAYPPKSPAGRSTSVCSDRSNVGSSLDSVSPTQFDHVDAHKTDDEFEERAPKTVDMVREVEEADESRKGIIDFADDLSDVSDIESNDSFGDAEPTKEEEKIEEPIEEPDPVPQTEVLEDKHEDAVSLHVETEEQLDFEAEEGECSPKPESRKIVVEEKEEVKPEKEQSDLEEGELTDDNDAKTEETERPVCRFFSRGHCTWGTNCRFIHPGVMDKGNYSMFDTVRPIVTPGGPPPPNSSGPMVYPMFMPHMAHPHLPGERGLPPPGPIRKEDQPAGESAWERGLRQAKEMIRKSSKRKETEVDFEDKKMNLTLNQDEIDKENDYYSRHSGSPVKSPDLAEKWKMEAEVKSHRGDPFGNDLPPPVPHSGPDVPPLGFYPPLHHGHGLSRPDYWPHRVGGGLPYDDYGLRAPLPPYGPDFYSAAAAGRRYMHPNSYYPPRAGGVAGPPAHLPDFYDRKQKHKPYPGSGREVIVQKNDKPYKDESPGRYRNRREGSPLVERTRDDEWADPWMRSRSPGSGRRRRRKNTYSSGSSYSSSSESSRSSSRTSLSSRSHQSRSRSKARSSGSRSSSRSPSQAVNRRKPMQFKLSPSSRPPVAPLKKNPKPISPSLVMERRAATERAMLMNPPPPSPKVKPRPHSPNNATTTSPTKPKSGLPDRLLAHSKAALTAAMRSARSSSRSSKSSSASSSSDTSSDSSDSSGSSSSSSRSRTPPIRAPKRNVPDERISVSQTVKPKAMDALKLSGQKQQIKLTLKGTGGSNKRIAENSENRKERQPLAGKKRVAESSGSDSDSDRASPAKKSAKMNPKKGPPSRRDELLKQLKAVEDAIARKRSKNL